MDRLFMDQLWSGNRKLYAELRRAHDAARQGAAGLLLAEQRTVVRSRRAQGFSARTFRTQAAGGELLPGRHDEGRVSRLGEDFARSRSANATGILHGDPAATNGKLKMVPYSQEYKA